MNTFSFFYVIQLLIWLVISPYIAYIFFNVNYEYINYLEVLIIPLILIYIVSFIGRKNFDLDFSNARLGVLLLLLLVELLFLSGINYLSRGDTAEMVEFNASLSVASLLMSKFIIYSNTFSFFIGLVNLKRNFILASFIITLSLVLQYYLSGLSKAAFINLIIIYFVLSGIRLSFKRITLTFLVFLTIISLVSLLRAEASTVSDLIKQLVIRTDGLSLVLQNDMKSIDWFSLAGSDYFKSIISSLLRIFGDNEFLLQGLTGPKAVYLYHLGSDELDYSASFVTDPIILFGFFFGIVLSMLLVIFLHRCIFLLSKTKLTIFKMSLLYSLILSSFMVDRSLLDYFLGPLKMVPFFYLYLRLLYRSKKEFH